MLSVGIFATIVDHCYVMFMCLLYSVDVNTADIGGCDVSFRGEITNPSVRISLSNIYIKVTGRYKKYVQ